MHTFYLCLCANTMHIHTFMVWVYQCCWPVIKLHWHWAHSCHLTEAKALVFIQTQQLEGKNEACRVRLMASYAAKWQGMSAVAIFHLHMCFLCAFVHNSVFKLLFEDKQQRRELRKKKGFQVFFSGNCTQCLCLANLSFFIHACSPNQKMSFYS